MLVIRAKRVIHQRLQFVVHASSMYVVVRPWLLAVIEQCSLTTCPHLVPCPGRRERRFYLPWGMMVRHTQFISLLTFIWITIWLLKFISITTSHYRHYQATLRDTCLF